MSAKTCISIFIVFLAIPTLIHASGVSTVLTAERTKEEIQIDGYPNEKAWDAANKLIVRVQDGSIGAVDISLKALYDSNYLYIVSSWLEPTESVSKDVWHYDGEKWTVSGDEDRLAIIWNIDESTAGFDIGGCAMLCHGDRMHTNAPSERADLWHWNAGETNPASYAGDYWIDNTIIPGYTDESTLGAFHDDSLSPGYVKNSNVNGTAPKYARPSDIQENITNPIFQADIDEGRVVSIDELQLKPGARVPGYILSRPQESDIDAKGIWRDGVWTLEMRRGLNTKDRNDVQFDTAKVYRFGIAVMDNTGGFEAFGEGHSFVLGARTLEFGGSGSEEITQLALVRDYLLSAETHAKRDARGLAISELNNALTIYNEISGSITAKDPELYLKSKKSFTHAKRDPNIVNVKELINDIDAVRLTIQGKRAPTKIPFRVELLVFWTRIQLYVFILLGILVFYPIYKILKVATRPQLRYMSIFLFVIIIPILFEAIGRVGALLQLRFLQALSFTTNEYITLLWTIGMLLALLIARYAFGEIDSTMGELEHKGMELEERMNEIQRLKDFNEDIILNAPVGVLTTDASSRITSINPQCFKMLGLESKEKVVGQNIADLFLVRRMRWDIQLKQALSGKPVLLLDEKYSLEPNKTIYASLHFTPLYDRKGGIDGIIILMEDNTQRKLMQEKFAQTEKLTAMGKLTASVAHEINNPLTGIMNCVHLVLDEMDKNDPKRKYLNMADGELNRMARIVRRLLNSFGPSTDQMNPLSVNEVLEEVLELLKTQLVSNNINVQKDLDPHLPKVMASHEQLKEVFLNVLINAQESMPNGGNIFVESYVNREDIIITIRDTGIGIPEKSINKIFDPFFTTKKGKGTGLGLSVSYGIIQAHGGTISASGKENEGTISASGKENEGTKITITLPIYKRGEKND